MQQIIICEDDPVQLQELEAYTKQCIEGEIETLTYTSGRILLDDLEQLSNPCIFLMDIMLKDENGIEIAKQINAKQPKSSIIFITAYLNLVTDVFDTNHCYFVLKSDLHHRLRIALQKAIEQQNQNKMVISLQQGAKKIVIHTEDILYIERKLRITYFHLDTRIEKVYTSFDLILEKLPTYFQRCHNSYIVNFKQIKEIGRNDITLHNDICLPISRAYSNQVKQKFKDYVVELV